MENIILTAIIALCTIAFNVYVITSLHKDRVLSSKKEPPISSYINRIEYTEKMMEFIRQFTIQISVIRYRQFLDEHELDKITKSQIQKLVTETATAVNESFSQEPIKYDELLLTKDFVNTYIIQTSILAIKDLLEKSVNENI